MMVPLRHDRNSLRRRSCAGYTKRLQNGSLYASCLSVRGCGLTAACWAVPESLDLRLFMNKYLTDRANASFNRRATQTTPAKRY